jgi:hypothetical protein
MPDLTNAPSVPFVVRLKGKSNSLNPQLSYLGHIFQLVLVQTPLLEPLTEDRIGQTDVCPNTWCVGQPGLP